MSASYGFGDIGLFSGGAGTSSTSTGTSSVSQGNVGATLDLRSLQSIQGHTIIDSTGLTGQEALNFASLVAETASKESSQAVKQTTSSISSSLGKIGLFAGGGLLLAVLAFFALKK